jgi:hypothetical protein
VVLILKKDQLFNNSSGNNYEPIPIKQQKSLINLKYKIMKRADKSSETIKNLDQLISKLSENGVLDIQAMSYIRGGDGEGDGGANVIIRPKF